MEFNFGCFHNVSNRPAPTVNVSLAVSLWLIAFHYVAHHGLNLGPILSHFGYHFHSDDLLRLDQSQREMIEQRFKSRKTTLRLVHEKGV